MAYYLDICTPVTYEYFSKTNKNITGFKDRKRKVAANINMGDRFICYLTKLSRWVGLLEVCSEFFIDDTPRFIKRYDPYILRFRVKPLAWLEIEKGIPIKEDYIWDTLSFTKNFNKNSNKWTGKFRSSMTKVDDRDGEFLEEIVRNQKRAEKIYPYNKDKYQKWLLESNTKMVI